MSARPAHLRSRIASSRYRPDLSLNNGGNYKIPRLIINFYWFNKRVSRLSWQDIQKVVASSPIIFTLLTLYLAFTYTYTVLPSLLEPIFEGLLLPFLLLMAGILLVASYRNYQEVAV